MPDSIVAFLTARLDEDEIAARTAARVSRGERWRCPDDYGVFEAHSGDAAILIGSPSGYLRLELGAHVARHDPARVLADVAAKRALIADATDVPTISMRRALKRLAAPYADHPDYNPRWSVT
jgi:hypothetical protein